VQNAPVVVVDGEVDLAGAPVLRHVLDAARSRAPRRIVVDLFFVRFLDTAGPATDVRLVATTRATRRPLRFARVYERVVVHASRAAALAAPGRPGDGSRCPGGSPAPSLRGASPPAVRSRRFRGPPRASGTGRGVVRRRPALGGSEAEDGEQQCAVVGVVRSGRDHANGLVPLLAGQGEGIRRVVGERP
jgi:hypothetical protein